VVEVWIMAVVLPVPILRAGAWIRASLSPSARAWVIGEARKIVLSTRYETPQDLILRAEIRERFGPELISLGSRSSTLVVEALRFAVLLEAYETDFQAADQRTNQLFNILSTIIKTLDEEDEGILRNMT
jgi:hypothetical protein